MFYFLIQLQVSVCIARLIFWDLHVRVAKAVTELANGKSYTKANEAQMTWFVEIWVIWPTVPW